MYARENGCKWGSYTCYYASRGGHLSCLIYAYENNSPIDVERCLSVSHSSSSCFSYLNDLNETLKMSGKDATHSDEEDEEDYSN